MKHLNRLWNLRPFQIFSIFTLGWKYRNLTEQFIKFLVFPSLVNKPNRAKECIQSQANKSSWKFWLKTQLIFPLESNVEGNFHLLIFKSLSILNVVHTLVYCLSRCLISLLHQLKPVAWFNWSVICCFFPTLNDFTNLFIPFLCSLVLNSILRIEYFLVFKANCKKFI
jgi:hypothetical protein